jgi:hypothetical protein
VDCNVNVVLLVDSSDRVLYGVLRSENLVIACALCLMETAVTADRRIRRRKGGGEADGLEA